jgi:hypothetical protein
MKRLTTVTAFARVALNVSIWSETGAADDLHQHGRRVSPSSSAVQPAPRVEAPQTAPSNPAPAKADDMMHRMETMPAHDQYTCCGTGTSGRGNGAHDH